VYIIRATWIRSSFTAEKKFLKIKS